MNNEVLILGNGISRLLYEELIASWTGEIWGCNYIYLEFGDRLTRLTGHLEVLEKAAADRDARGHGYEIWAGKPEALAGPAHQFTCPGEFRKDSGTTLVAQALTEKRDRILVCGFDMGGRDIYTLGLHEQVKTCWARRWQDLAIVYGRQFWDSLEWVGYDHSVNLRRPDFDGTEYYRRYRKGGPHLPDAQYIALFALLYGRREIYRRDRVIRVRYIKGPRPGWETQYNDGVARKLAEKGEVEIIRDIVPEGEEPNEIAGDPKVASRMSKATLVKIAVLRGLLVPEDAEKFTKADLLEFLGEDDGR